MSDRLRCALCEQQYADGETVDQHNWSKHPAIMLSMGETPPSAETPSEPPKLQGDGPHMDPLFALTEQLEKCAGHVKAVADAMGLNLLHDDSRQARPQALSYVRPSELAGRVKLLMDATRSASAEGPTCDCHDKNRVPGPCRAAAPPSVGDTPSEPDADALAKVHEATAFVEWHWTTQRVLALQEAMRHVEARLRALAAATSCPTCQSPTRPTCFNPNCEAAFPELHATPTGTPRAVTDENAARLISRVKAGLQGGTRTMFDGLAALSALEDFLASRAGHRSGGGA